jgi:hypothetical protein
LDQHSEEYRFHWKQWMLAAQSFLFSSYITSWLQGGQAAQAEKGQ